MYKISYRAYLVIICVMAWELTIMNLRASLAFAATSRPKDTTDHPRAA